MKTRIRNSAQLKQEFLKKWIKGLHIYSNLNKIMTISDRKKAIKLSADVAIASTRNSATHWSRALMNDVVSRSDSCTERILVEQITGSKVEKKATSTALTPRGNRVLRRSLIARRKLKARRVVPRPRVKASSIARKLVRDRTRVLKRLVPGGENIMDDVCLVQETLDYIVSLRAQVDVMRNFANAAERLECSSKIIGLVID